MQYLRILKQEKSVFSAEQFKFHAQLNSKSFIISGLVESQVVERPFSRAIAHVLIFERYM